MASSRAARAIVGAAAALLLVVGAWFWLRGEPATPSSESANAVAARSTPADAPTDLPASTATAAEPLAEAAPGEAPSAAAERKHERLTLATVGVPYELRGRVIAPTGLPVAGAEVRHRPSPATLAAAGIYPQPFVGDRRFPWDELPRTTTDAQGRFALTVRELPRQDQPGRSEIRPGGGGFAPPVANVPSLVVLAAGFAAT